MNISSGKPWSKLDLFDLKEALEQEDSIEEVADLLCRDVDEVITKARQLGLRYTRRQGHGRLKGHGKTAGLCRSG